MHEPGIELLITIAKHQSPGRMCYWQSGGFAHSGAPQTLSDALSHTTRPWPPCHQATGIFSSALRSRDMVVTRSVVDQHDRRCTGRDLA